MSNIYLYVLLKVRNLNNSGIVLPNVRIPTLADRVRILNLHKSIPELSVRKVGVGYKVRISIVACFMHFFLNMGNVKIISCIFVLLLALSLPNNWLKYFSDISFITWANATVLPDHLVILFCTGYNFCYTVVHCLNMDVFRLCD